MFIDEDEEEVAHPYEDALVVKVTLIEHELNQALVNEDSLANNLFKQTLDDLQISSLILNLIRTTLKWFRGAKLIPLG